MTIAVWLLGIVCLLFAGVATYYFLETRTLGNKVGSLGEYKELFVEADALQKEGQSRVESLLREQGIKNVQLERGVEVLRQAASKDEQIAALQAAITFQEEQYEKLFGQKKSSEVRTGKIAEQIAPFLEDYPVSPRTARFIGDPIDFVHFEEDKVIFVEVKSGKSTLSKKQRHIRDLIKDGKVEFVIYRVEGK